MQAYGKPEHHLRELPTEDRNGMMLAEKAEKEKTLTF